MQLVPWRKSWHRMSGPLVRLSLSPFFNSNVVAHFGRLLTKLWAWQGGSPAFQARIHCGGNSDLPDPSGRKVLEIDVKRGMVHNVDVTYSCGTVTTGSLAAAITAVLKGQKFRSQAFLAAADESARSGLADSNAAADALRIAAHHLQEVE